MWATIVESAAQHSTTTHYDLNKQQGIKAELMAQLLYCTAWCGTGVSNNLTNSDS